MRKSSLALIFLFLVTSVILQALPAGAAWVGTHSFSLAVQGSVTSMDLLTSSSQSIPVEFRAKLLVTVEAPNASGQYSGRLRLDEVSLHQEGEVLSIPVAPAGYRIRLHSDQPHEILDDTDALSALGVNLSEILAMLFPVPPGQELTEGASWRLAYTQTAQIDGLDLPMAMQNTFTVNEQRSSVVVIQSSLRGSASRDLNPGKLSSDQLGSGVLHVDPSTGELLRSAITVRSTIERNIPIGATVPQERSLIRALVTTSIERLQATPRQIPSLGAEYVDPVGRYTLRLPQGWQAEPFHLDHTLTLFASPDRRHQLYVDMALSEVTQSPSEIAELMLAHYGRLLVDFTVTQPPTPAMLGGHPAVLTSYRYNDGTEMVETALFTQIEGYNLALQLASDATADSGDGSRVLGLISEHFSFGPSPQGSVSAEQLIMSPTILYEGRDHAFDIEVPMLWPSIETGDGSITFMELGGAGQVNVHLEVVAPNELPATLLTQWVERMEASGSGVRAISPVEQDALGPLSAASTVIEMVRGERTLRNKVVAANLEGLLYVVMVGYESEGYEEREAVFERIFSGFRPRPDYIAAQASIFDAYTAPPSPEGEEPFLIIGRILHEIEGSAPQPAAGVRIEFSTQGRTYAAITDNDGFYYLANLPVQPGDLVVVDSVRGSLFDLPYDVNIALAGLSLTVQSQVGLIPELIFALQSDSSQVSIRLDDGMDFETGQSRIHQAFLSRFPDSPWSELVRSDLEALLNQ